MLVKRKPPCAVYGDVRLVPEFLEGVEFHGIWFVPKIHFRQRLPIGRIATITMDRFWAEILQFEHDFMLRIAKTANAIIEAINFRLVQTDRIREVGQNRGRRRLRTWHPMRDNKPADERRS